MSKAQLTCLNSIVLTVHQLEAVKPMKTENEFHTIGKDKGGKLVLQNSRFKTRVRPSAQTQVVMETFRGHRLVGQAIKADGKQTHIQLLKGKFHGNIKRISVLGREELTCAEMARDEFILQLLRREISLLSLPMHVTNVPGQQFIEMLWFPRKKSPQGSRLSHVSPLSTAFMDLNDSQRQVAAAMISHTEPLVIAHGPPGTGKTTTIAAAVDYWQREPQPVWIIAQSNVGVKNIARSFAKKQSIDFKLIVSKEFYVEWHEDLYDQVKHNLIRSDDLTRIGDRIETERMLAGSQVILCTLSMLSNPVLDGTGVYGLVPMERLVVDEASQISVSEYMHLFHKFTKLEKMCFFGDPNQLPPYGREDAPGMQSIFDIKHLKSGSYFLDTQYRMPTPLGNFISDEVYDKRLKSVHKIHEISCVSFVDVDKGTEKRCGKSWTNTEEVHVVVNLVRYYYHNQPFVVITPYDAQRVAIQNALEKANLPSNCVYNVDSFQGKLITHVLMSHAQ
ncbi:hypothetical protein EW026_g8158 [Hermanssonia centrifuga]|uniref:DNA2/NAM7 helicase-like C-terminal domain-containing protein n=1 Tax=Hermanssonia centrifuga TaxID=98765 RepID=A0A4S4K6B1_9APHY|nr:hypothetical protein EW026_g8158 [Hermanssonia centrifuga]